jgi:hypothetical protein
LTTLANGAAPTLLPDASVKRLSYLPRSPKAACAYARVPFGCLIRKSRGAFVSEIGTLMQTLAGSIVKRISLCGLNRYW